jgi:hypothetical protein
VTPNASRINGRHVEDMNDTKWYVRVRGKVMGPFDLEQLRSLRARGQVGRFHEISTDRHTWQKASMLTELFSAPAAHAAAPSEQSAREPAEAEWELPLIDTREDEQATWYYVKDGSPVGPIDTPALQRMATIGQIGPNDQVWQEGTRDWVRAATVPALGFPPTPAASAYPLVLGPAYSSSAPAPRTSGLAVASLVLGILWLWGLGSLLAVIFGATAISQISKASNQITGKGMAIAGLVLGIVGLTLLLLGLLAYSEWSTY